MFTRILSIAALSLSFHAVRSLADPAPELVRMEIQSVHIPNGFDSNDKTQVVIDGMLPNPCYKVGPQKAQLDAANHVIKIEQWVYRYPGMICPQVLVPFAAVVDLGILGVNTYEIKDGATDRVLGNLNIRPSNNLGPDDYFYAPITDASVDLKEGLITLEGTFTNRCLVFQEIKAFADPKDVVIVMPILKPWTGGRDCPAGRYPFKVTAKLPPLQIGRYLLHVRSMNGQAVNKLFEIYGH